MVFPSFRNLAATASVAMASAVPVQAGDAISATGPKIDFIKIDETITLRRMHADAANAKGTVLFLHGFPETLFA